MEKYIEHSEIHLRNGIIIAAAFAFIAGILILTTYFAVTGHSVTIIEQSIELALLVWLFLRAGAKYTYELDKRGIRLTRTRRMLMIGGVKTIEIPYRDVIGVYQYAPKLVSILKFRRTYQYHSALDGKSVWAIAYTATGWGNKLENRRVFFKPTDAMLAAIEEKLPGKVKVTEESVSLEQIKQEK